MRNVDRGAHAPRPDGRGFDEAEEAELRATCRRQAVTIQALARAVGDLRTGASALKAENAELRSERRRMRQHRADVVWAGLSDRGGYVEEQVALGLDAPATARRMVAEALADLVPASVIERAKQTISELFTKSVCHGGMPAGGHALVRLKLTDELLRLEVEDPGRGGAVVRRRPDARLGGGFGLHVVETLSERWGSERRASGALRVWAELSLQDTPVPHAAPQRREEVRVMPEPRAGTWSVHLDADSALSEHTSETAAEAAARAQAALHDCTRIVVHDRYFRTRSMSLRPGPGTAGS
jgi:hypothetical protein